MLRENTTFASFWNTIFSSVLFFRIHMCIPYTVYVKCPQNSAEIFHFHTIELPSKLALTSAEDHGVPKGRFSRNSAVFHVQNFEFLWFSTVVHVQVVNNREVMVMIRSTLAVFFCCNCYAESATLAMILQPRVSTSTLRTNCKSDSGWFWSATAQIRIGQRMRRKLGKQKAEIGKQFMARYQSSNKKENWQAIRGCLRTYKNLRVIFLKVRSPSSHVKSKAYSTKLFLGKFNLVRWSL